MCAIAGVFRFATASAGEADLASVETMLARMMHRGPDDRGLHREGPVALGHRRLAILDLSAAGHQPMRSARGQLVVSFNGEIYNFDELRRELGLAQSDLRSTTDTEILLHAWERWGAAALDRMVGQWAFALYERDEHRLWLVRDRFGEKPLFYHRGDDAIAFASSLQALLQVPWAPKDIDRAALAEYLTLRYVVAPRTIVRGCRKIPAGHLLAVTPFGAEERPWYEARFRARPRKATPRPRAELTEEFGSLLVQASKRCLVSDVPVGLLLSDGIDSHGIHAAIAAQGDDVSTFTYTMVPEGEGLRRSPPEASVRSTRWDVLVTPERRTASIERAFSSLTEPVGDGASLATWLIIHEAREQAEVFLCGHGGDEVLGGYRLSQDRFRLAALHRMAWLPAWSLRLLVESKVFGGESAAVRQQAVWDATPSEVPAAARYLIHHPLPLGDVCALFTRSALPEPYLGTIDRLYGECAPHAADLDRIQEVMIRTFLTENILSFADSVAMDSSAELRMPFLDRDVVEFVLGLDPSDRVSPWPGRANTKQILRRWASGRVADDVLHRRKHGFNYGPVRDLLDRPGADLRERLGGTPFLRDALPGLPGWLAQPTEAFTGHREKAVWSLLALSHWGEAAGIRGVA